LLAEVAEAELEAELALLLGEVEDAAALLAVRVTPTARQSCWASDSAVVRSLPVQELWMQDVTLLTKAEDLQRQVSSDELQPS